MTSRVLNCRIYRSGKKSSNINNLSMNHRSEYSGLKHKNRKEGRKIFTKSLRPAFYFVILITTYHLAGIVTLAVSAEAAADAENEDVVFEEKRESGIKYGDQGRNVIFSSYDLIEKNAAIDKQRINYTKEGGSSVGTADNSENSQETHKSTSNKSSDASTNNIQNYPGNESGQKNDSIADDSYSEEDELVDDKSRRENIDETATTEVEKVERTNEADESIDESIEENNSEESIKNTMDIIDNVETYPKNNLENGENQDTSDSSSEKNAESTDKKNETNIVGRTSGVSSTSFTNNDRVSENETDLMTENVSVEKPLQSVGHANPEEEKEKALKNNANTDLDVDFLEGNKGKDKEIRIESAGIKDDDTGTITIEETYDDRTQSQKDLSSIENASNLDVDLRKGDTETELGESHIVSALINDDDTDQIITEELHDDHTRAEKDLGNIENTNATEVPADVTNIGYRGEPWGQYRSTRRLPDLELLRLVFENANKTVTRARRDTMSQKVLEEWRKDPLYDDALTENTGSQEQIVIDEEDQNLSDETANAMQGSKLNSGNSETVEETQEKNPIVSNDKDDNADVNSEFVEGIEGIHDFFEGVDPPDELDVGYGTSIQDVLIDKGKHILLKKVRGGIHWIRIGWKTIGRKLEERISQFQLPFQKVNLGTATVPDESAANSSESSLTDLKRDQIVHTVQESLISAWKIGKNIIGTISDLVDGLLDRFDARNEGDSETFKDFEGFDLENLSTYTHPA